MERQQFFDELVILYPEHRNYINKARHSCQGNEVYMLLFYLRTNSNQSRSGNASMHDVDIIDRLKSREIDVVHGRGRGSCGTEYYIVPRDLRTEKTNLATRILEKIRDNPMITPDELAQLL